MNMEPRGMDDLDEREPFLGTDGLIYHGNGELDIEASAEMYDKQGPDEDGEDDGQFTPWRWCVLCGWATGDPDQNTCECPDGTPRG
jgi:hypothetical protein